MAVPKLPLVVPKKAISTSSSLVPKIAPKLAPVLLPKGPPSAKSIHSGTNIPARPLNNTSDQKSSDKLTKLVSHNNSNTNKPNSTGESHNDLGSTHGDLNSIEAQVVPAQAFSQNPNNFDHKNNILNTRRQSNTSFHNDLASRLNNSNILNDLNDSQYNKSLSRTSSKDENINSEKLLKAASLQHETLSRNGSTETNSAFKNDSNMLSIDKLEADGDERDDVGYTPWLKIERRINQIRSVASKDLNNKSCPNKAKQTPGLYNNYNTQYVEGKWKKELNHPLSYGMVQKLSDKRQFELPRDNWKFINGFIKPRRKPFTSMSEMSKHFQKVDTKDQYELIKLLLACRDLEKLIEEQHTVLDMLDHDLREARDLFPDSLNNVTTQKLHGSAPEEEPFFPSSEAPLFIKGRVFLLPNQGKNGKGNGKK